MFPLRATLVSLILYLGLDDYAVKCTASQVSVDSYLALEAIYINKLDEYLQKVQEKNDKIIRYLAYLDLVHDSIEDSEEYFGNPLNAFVTINRFVNNWQHEIFYEMTSNQDFESLKQSLDEALENVDEDAPTEDALLEATRDVLTYQGYNNLHISQLASGKIEDTNEQEFEDSDEFIKQPIRLTASECYTLGRNLYKLQKYDIAAEWLLQARSQLSLDSHTFPNVTQVQILESLAPAYAGLGNFKLANKIYNDLLRLDPKHEAAFQAKIELEHKLVLERSEVLI